MHYESKNSRYDPSKIKSIKQTLTDKFLELVGLKNLEDINQKSGCIELEIEKIKHFKNSSYDKYSDAIFYVLDRLYKNKSTVIQRLYNLSSSQKSEVDMYDIPENHSLTKHECICADNTSSIKNSSTRIETTPSTLRIKNSSNYDSLLNCKNNGKQTINDIFKFNPSENEFEGRVNEICVKGSKIQKHKLKLSNDTESPNENLHNTVHFTFKRETVRNSLTYETDKIENDEKRSLINTPSK